MRRCSATQCVSHAARAHQVTHEGVGHQKGGWEQPSVSLAVWAATRGAALPLHTYPMRRAHPRRPTKGWVTRKLVGKNQMFHLHAGPQHEALQCHSIRFPCGARAPGDPRQETFPGNRKLSQATRKDPKQTTVCLHISTCMCVRVRVRGLRRRRRSCYAGRPKKHARVVAPAPPSSTSARLPAAAP